MVGAGRRPGQVAGVDGALRDGGQQQTVPAGVVAHEVEGVSEGDLAVRGEVALGLFDEDAAVRGAVQLFVDDAGVGVPEGTGVDQTDGGRVGERLRHGEVVQRHRAVGGPQEQQAAEGLPAQPQRDGAGIGVTGAPGLCGEVGPGGGGLGEVPGGNGLGGAVGVQSRAFAQRQVQHLGQGRAGVAGRGAVHLRARIGQYDRGVGDGEDVPAADGQLLQEVDDVEVRDKGVGEFDEGLGDLAFPAHVPTPRYAGAGTAGPCRAAVSRRQLPEDAADTSGGRS